MRGYAAIGLWNVKTSANVGSALRAAFNFGAAMLVVSGRRYRSSPTDVHHTTRHIPLIQVADLHAAVPFDCVPVAVELIEGARSLCDYTHPQRAFYVFGPEDGTLGKTVLSWCRDVVYIPTNHCLNLGTCVGIVLYDRMVKARRKPNGTIDQAMIAEALAETSVTGASVPFGPIGKAALTSLATKLRNR